jgi:hypothetical protein
VTRRVLNAFLAEALKLRRRWIGYAAFGLALATVGLSAVFVRIGEAAARMQSGERAVVAANGFVAFADCLGNGVFVGSIFLLIFAGLLMAEEAELGTAKVLFSKPLRRSEIVLAKGVLLLTLAVALVAVVAVASYAVAGTFFGFGDVVERNKSGEVIYVYHAASVMHGHVLRAIPQLIPPLFAALAIAFLMSALSEQSGIAVGLSFGLLVMSMAVTWLSSRAAPYLVTSYFGFATDTLRGFATGESTAAWGVRWEKGPPKLLLGLAVSTGTALLCWVVAGVVVARRAILGLLLSLGVAAGALGEAGEAHAATPPEFQKTELEVTGQVWDVTPIDMDWDGQDDLVVFHVIGRRGPEPRRFLSFFYARKAGVRYERRPDQTFEVPVDACARFLADVDPLAKGREIGFIGPRGAFSYAAKDRRFDLAHRRVLLEEPGFYDIAAGTQLPDWSGLARDLDGDGRSDLLFPKKGTFALYLAQPQGLARAVERPLDYKQQFGTRIETLLLNRFVNYWAGLSKPALADVNGDRKLDIITYRDQGLDVYLQRTGVAGRPAEAFAVDPDRRLPLKLMSDEAGGGGDDSYNSVNAAFDDVDGDALADLVLYRNVGKVGLFETMRTQVLLHRAQAASAAGAGPGGEAPDQILNLKGVSINPALIDVDRDGAKDLVVSSLRTDLVTNAKRALFSSVTVTYYVFRFAKDEKRFSETPDYAKDLSIDVARIEGGGTIPLAFFFGDYDGDKVPDLLSLESSEEVAIFPGKAEDSFWSGRSLDYDESEKRVVEVETSNSIKIQDLDKDGKSDFLFWYWDKNWEAKERGLVRVVMAR